MTDETLTTTIDLLRHGACEGDGEFIRGATDHLLSAEGFEHMSHSMGDTPPKWDAIVSSPLRRCVDFSETLAEQYQCDFYQDQRLAEIDFGDWDGMKTDDIAKRWPDKLEQFWQNPMDFPPPNAETMQDFQARVIDAKRALINQLKGKHTLVVSHGGVIRMMLADVLGMPIRPLSRLHIPHGSLSRVQIFHQAGQEDWPQVMFINNVYP